MKKIWIAFVKQYIRIGMFFYFKRITIHDVEHVPKNKPVLVLSNHQNALLDALLIAITCGRSSYFLTRAGVFNKPFVARILKSLQMLPVYRVRDGWGNLANNNNTFKACTDLLNADACIVIFPEGNHNLKRTVRPLSKGFTRIILEALGRYPDMDLQLLPVGVNYTNAEKFTDEAAIYFGRPIAAKNYMSDSKNETVVALKTKIQSEISQLTTHIPFDSYQNSIDRLERLNADFLNPKAVNQCIASQYQNCTFNTVKPNSRFKSLFKHLLSIVFLGPVLVWKGIVKPKIKDIEFMSTFRFAMAITLVPLWLLICFTAIVFASGLHMAMGYLIMSIGVSLLAVKS